MVGRVIYIRLRLVVGVYVHFRQIASYIVTTKLNGEDKPVLLDIVIYNPLTVV
jgi:hypothetical protein